MKSRFTLILLLGLCWIAANLPGEAQTPQQLPTITLAVGKATMSAEVAITAQQREIGLMYRTQMADNDGMIFAMPTIGPATFWMKNTLIPLSIAFLDKNGVILEIHDMKALDETITHSTSNQIAYALEANLNWFSLNGIKPGDKVTVPNGTLPKPVAANP